MLAQLADAGGELRMTELADRAFSSRSGMTRRIDRLVEEGLVRRAGADADARGVVVALTDAGVARLTETAPVHLRGVAETFVAQLDDRGARRSRARPEQGHPRLHVWLRAESAKSTEIITDTLPSEKTDVSSLWIILPPVIEPFAELSDLVGMRGNLLAHHLDVLEDAGLIEGRPSEGDHRRRYVSLRWEGLASASRATCRP